MTRRTVIRPAAAPRSHAASPRPKAPAPVPKTSSSRVDGLWRGPPRPGSNQAEPTTPNERMARLMHRLSDLS